MLDWKKIKNKIENSREFNYGFTQGKYTDSNGDHCAIGCLFNERMLEIIRNQDYNSKGLLRIFVTNRLVKRYLEVCYGNLKELDRDDLNNLDHLQDINDGAPKEVQKERIFAFLERMTK